MPVRMPPCPFACEGFQDVDSRCHVCGKHVVAGQFYWIRYRASGFGDTVEVGLPYFDENGWVKHWDTVGTDAVLMPDRVTVLEHIPMPRT